MELHIRLAQCGLVHCDFNEFNVMINDEEELTMIDFPQMVSTSHRNAAYYFNRDVECLRLFFERRYGFQASSVPTLADCTTRIMELDKLAAASGFTKEDAAALDEAMETYRQNVGKPEDDHVPHARTHFSTGENESSEASEEEEDAADESEEEIEAGEEGVGDSQGSRPCDQPDVGGSITEAGSIDKAGEKFVRLQVVADADGDGGGESGSEDEEDGDDEDAAAVASLNVAAPDEYDRDDDIRRAWRFSARPTGSGRGGAAGAPAGGRGRGGGGRRTADDDGTGTWKKAARNKVKDRQRAKINQVIKDSR